MSIVEDYIRNDRNDFNKSTLEEKNVLENPIEQFKLWLQQAISSKVNEPYALNLATVSEENKPSNRILYIRDMTEEGMIFYTNYLSRKGHSLSHNPFASACFFWPELERQVRIEGQVIKADSSLSDEYFASRPRKSKLGAWASLQSQFLDSYQSLEAKVEELDKQFGEGIPRPESWGGYILQPNYFEFWQGRPSRLHDRIVYTQDKKGIWEITRLYP